MITVAEENAATCIGTLCHLYAEHGKEVIGKDFNLNLAMFVEASVSGRMRFIVARDSKGEAIGYACFSIYRDGMKADSISADCQAIYVKPEYRGKTSIRIIKVAENEFRKSGVSRIYMHIPSSTPQVARMFTKPKMRYIHSEYMLEKEL